jgi:hypothetical protein
MDKNRNRYKLALDAAAVMDGFKDYKDAIRCLKGLSATVSGAVNEILSIHTRAAEIFAMGFAEWKDDNQFTRYNNEWTSTKAYYAGRVYTTEQLLTLYNNA